MIHVVYVIDERSGMNLLFRTYGELNYDEALMSGFLTAIRQFSSQLRKEPKEENRDIIQEIEMRTYKIVYASEERVLTVAIADYEDSTPIIRRALKDLALRFSEKYSGALVNWCGDVSIFSDFIPEVDRILMEGRISETVKKPKIKSKLTRTMVRIGFISEEEFKVGELCDGKRTGESIANELGLPIENVIEAIRGLEKKELIEWI